MPARYINNVYFNDVGVVPLTQQRLDEIAAATVKEENRIAIQTDRTAALQYQKLRTLAQMSPAQIQAWIDANVTNLATAQDAIKTLAVGLSILIRRELNE